MAHPICLLFDWLPRKFWKKKKNKHYCNCVYVEHFSRLVEVWSENKLHQLTYARDNCLIINIFIIVCWLCLMSTSGKLYVPFWNVCRTPRFAISVDVFSQKSVEIKQTLVRKNKWIFRLFPLAWKSCFS